MSTYNGEIAKNIELAVNVNLRKNKMTLEEFNRLFEEFIQANEFSYIGKIKPSDWED